MFVGLPPEPPKRFPPQQTAPDAPSNGPGDPHFDGRYVCAEHHGGRDHQGAALGGRFSSNGGRAIGWYCRCLGKQNMHIVCFFQV